MPLNFEFGSPGGAASDAFQSALLQQEELKRQALRDELNKRNIESEIQTREQQRKTAEENAQSLREQREASAKKAQEDAKDKLIAREEKNPSLPLGLKVSNPAVIKQVEEHYKTMGYPSPFEKGETVSGGPVSSAPNGVVPGGQSVNAEGQPDPLATAVAGASNRKEAIRKYLAAGGDFAKAESYVNSVFGATRAPKPSAQPEKVEMPSTFTGTPGHQALAQFAVDYQNAKTPQEAVAAMIKAEARGADKDKLKDVSASFAQAMPKDKIHGGVFNRDPRTQVITDADNKVVRLDDPRLQEPGVKILNKAFEPPAVAAQGQMAALMTPDVTEMLAKMFRSGDPQALQAVGSAMSGMTVPLKLGVLKKAAERDPITGELPNIAATRLIRSSLSATLKQQQEAVSSLTTFTKTASDNLDLVQGASDRNARTDTQFINRVVNGFIRSGTSGEQLSDFETKVYTAVREYAKAAQATGTISGAALTDSAAEEATKLLNAAQTPGQLKAAIAAMKADMSNMVKEREATVKDVKAQIDHLGGTSPAVVGPGSDKDPLGIRSGAGSPSSSDPLGIR